MRRMAAGSAYRVSAANVTPPPTYQIPPNKDRHGSNKYAGMSAIVKPLNSSRVSIDIFPSTVRSASEDDCCTADSEVVVTKITKPLDQTSMLNECLLFNANVTSLSSKAKDYIFNLPSDVKYLTLSEIHHKDQRGVEEVFKSKGFSASFNPSQVTPKGGTHGGELVANRSHIQANCIKNRFWKRFPRPSMPPYISLRRLSN
jgi:hypothetical protein